VPQREQPRSELGVDVGEGGGEGGPVVALVVVVVPASEACVSVRHTHA